MPKMNKFTFILSVFSVFMLSCKSNEDVATMANTKVDPDVPEHVRYNSEVKRIMICAIKFPNDYRDVMLTDLQGARNITITETPRTKATKSTRSVSDEEYERMFFGFIKNPTLMKYEFTDDMGSVESDDHHVITIQSQVDGISTMFVIPIGKEPQEFKTWANLFKQKKHNKAQ